jgi:hypothetical protein
MAAVDGTDVIIHCHAQLSSLYHSASTNYTTAYGINKNSIHNVCKEVT